MNPSSDQHPAHPAKVRPSKTLASTIWLIPLAAAIVGGYLLVQNARSKGPEITLYMDNADDIEVNNTTIRVLNVEVGRVVKIRLRPDRSGVELTARLNRESEDLMRKDTQFWVVKPRIDQNGVTGLGTLLSGSYIAFSPGSSEEEAHRFEVSELPPITAIGQSGVRFTLSGKNNKMVSAGSPVLYENHVVGSVETAKFNPADQTVQYSIFIESPNENLVNADSRFWLSSGISVQMESSGIKIDSAPLPALLSGAIAFDTPGGNSSSVKPASSGSSFTIYNNRAEIENRPNVRTLYYVAFFKNSVRGLSAGAPVEYKGIRIGSVAQVPYFQQGDYTRLFENGYVPVRLRIDPDRIEQGADNHSKEYWQDTLQQAFNRGLTAAIAADNLVLGSKMVELAEHSGSGAPLKPHSQYGGDTVIATRNGGGLDDLQAQLSQLLDKFNALPLHETVAGLNGSLKELRATLASANKLISQNSTQKMPAELNRTLTQLRQTLDGISPQSPLYQEVQNTLNSIDRTLKNAQPVLDTLKQQPNALIFKSSRPDPVPQGKQP